MSKVKIKICGIKDANTALQVIELGADFIGFIFYKKSHRYILPDRVKEIIEKCRKRCIEKCKKKVQFVGIFVNESVEKVNKISNECDLDIVQYYGTQDLSKIEKKLWQVIKIDDEGKCTKSKTHKNTIGIVLEPLTNSEKMLGGNGKLGNIRRWNIKEIKSYYKDKQIILAGGLNVQNVQDAIKIINPDVVDVSSGVETNNIKDIEKIKEFIVSI